MPNGVKIATCCYCGMRAALVFTTGERHELACSGCGAPLRELKTLRPVEDRHGRRELVRPIPAHPRRKIPAWEDRHRESVARRRKKKPGKTVLRHFFDEALDAIEDIFD